ncbi:MAG: hypothetical protein LBS39_01755, partial [Campylobacteraceae bacterium]|nr:hypothetical protein [Campylobacteraceae bacterium]
MRFFIYLCTILLIFTGCSFKETSLSEVLRYEQKADILTDTPTISQKEFEEFEKIFSEKYFSVWSKNSLWTNLKDASIG